MKGLVKKALIFIFAVALMFSCIYLITNSAGNKNQTGQIDLNSPPGGTYDPAGNNSWQYNNNMANEYGGGLGVEGNAFKINNAWQLAYMASRINSGNDSTAFFELTDNIDLSDWYWVPIGLNSAVPFKGVFDGKGKNINGLYIGNPTVTPAINANLQYAGLFGFLAGNCIIRNVNVECYIQYSPLASYVGAYGVGGIAGFGDGTRLTIERCTVSGMINSGSGLQGIRVFMGGIIGGNVIDSRICGEIIITNCINMATLSDKGAAAQTICQTAGIIAMANDATIKDCGNYGNITLTSAGNTAGIVATIYENYDGSGLGNIVDSCFNTGDIDITCTGQSFGRNVGGIIAEVFSYFKLINSYSTGSIFVEGTGSTQGYGGLVGWGGGTGTIDNCFFAGDISINGIIAGSRIGILMGTCHSITMNNSYYNTSANMMYNYNKDEIKLPIGNYTQSVSSVTAEGLSAEEMFSEDFANRLENNRETSFFKGEGTAGWGFTGDFPTLEFDIRSLLITFIFHNEKTPGRRILSQPVSGKCKLPDVYYEGHKFLGWFENENGTGFKIDLETTTVEDLILEGIKTFHAVWQGSETWYNFTVELYDSNGKISEDSIISTLISGTSFESIDTDAPVSEIIFIKNGNPNYRFLYFEDASGTIYKGEKALEGLTADHFSATHTPNEDIILKAYFMRRYNVSFLSGNNPTIVDATGGYTAAVFATIEGDYLGDREIRGFFQGMFDAGTIITINYVTNPGRAVKSIKFVTLNDTFSGSNYYTLNADTNIEIEIESSIITLGFEVIVVDYTGEIPDGLMPRLQSGITSFTIDHYAAETIVINQSTDYSLNRYELWLKGPGGNEIFYAYLSTDAYGYSSFKISELLLPYNPQAEEIKIIAVYERIVSLNFSHAGGSDPGMGSVKVLKNGTVINLANGKSPDIKYGDEIVIKLAPNTGYKYNDENGFLNGEKTLTLDGQMTVEIEFSRILYNLAINDSAKLNKPTAYINDNIVINTDIGAIYQLSGFVLKIGGKVIDEKFIKTSGGSLTINLNKDFIDEYGVGSDIIFDLDFNQQLSSGFIAATSTGSAVLIIAAILIVLFIIKLRKRRRQLKQAELETQMGHARLSISDNLKNIRDE